MTMTWKLRSAELQIIMSTQKNFEWDALCNEALFGGPYLDGNGPLNPFTEPVFLGGVAW